MKKGVLIILTVLILSLAFVFVGCSSKSYGYSGEYQPDNGGEYIDKEIVSGESETFATQERKIIYTAYANITADNVNDSIKTLNSMLNDGEWVETSQTSDYYAKVVLRIKSERLNSFMENLSELGTVNSTEVSSNDISLAYSDTTLRKSTLENEYQRLNELLVSASSMNDILTINKRLAEIETELQKIQSTLNKYDSLIEYSSVTITMYKKGEEPKKTTFGDKVGTAYGVNGKIIEGLGIFLIAILPYLAFSAILAVAIILIRKQVKKKKQAKLNQANGLSENNGDNKAVPLNNNSSDENK